MKKMLGVLLVGVLALFMASGCASLKKITGQDKTIVPVEKIEIAKAEDLEPSVSTVSVSEPPASGEIVDAVDVVEDDRDLEVREFGNGYITVFIPIFEDQNNSWQVHASVGWTDGEKWEIVSMESYSRSTSVVNGWAISRINLPAKGIGWYWIRAWGWDNQGWFPINKESKFYRVAADGKPGYEFLVNPALQKIQPVSENYNSRK